jgi:hypothetical protein
MDKYHAAFLAIRFVVAGLGWIFFPKNKLGDMRILRKV